MRTTGLWLIAFAAWLAAPAAAHAQWTNAERYQVVSASLADTAPTTDPVASNFASAWFDVPEAPIQLRRFDTPGNDSFGAGTQLGNTAAFINELLQSIRECGNQCYVDLASLDRIDGVQNWVAGAIQQWSQGKPADAKLILRITIGFLTTRNASMGTYLDFWKPTVFNAGGRVDVYGVHMGSGAPGFGTWSHVKTFGVYDLSNDRYKLLFGGQNHWVEYNNARPPFDTNTMVDGHAAVGEALQIDAAVRWFGANRTFTGFRLWWDTVADDFAIHRYRVGEPGYDNVFFGSFSGIWGSNPRTMGPPAANQRALVSLMDMGRYSVGHVGRTIARSLHDLVASEPKDNHIRVWQQRICRNTEAFLDGNCSGRSEQTYLGRLVYRALTSARMGWATNVWVLTSADVPIANQGYAGPTAKKTRRMLYDTAYAQACDGWWTFKQGWSDLRFFDNPRGRGSCWAAVIRAVEGRFAMRMTRAPVFLGGGGLQRVGEHHKLVMFGTEAMYQGSFNAYQSEVTSGTDTTYDSKLVENGAIIFDSGYVSDHVNAFETAWANAIPIIGGQ